MHNQLGALYNDAYDLDLLQDEPDELMIGIAEHEEGGPAGAPDTYEEAGLSLLW